MTERDRQTSEIIAREGSRLKRFIRRRVGNESDAEDLLQDVFFRLVEANRLLMPVEHVTGWLYEVARNRITDLFRRKKPEPLGERENEEGERLPLEELLPSPEAGPEELYERHVLLEELETALAELPEEQRAVFVAHEIDGKSFRQLSAETGIGINTLLSRKRYAVRRLRERLQEARDEFLSK